MDFDSLFAHMLDRPQLYEARRVKLDAQTYRGIFWSAQDTKFQLQFETQSASIISSSYVRINLYGGASKNLLLSIDSSDIDFPEFKKKFESVFEVVESFNKHSLFHRPQSFLMRADDPFTDYIDNKLDEKFGVLFDAENRDRPD